ncbi:MAG: diacylglycerol kinase [Synergistaceae bacterium]|nr:diacylglycerol kinase [Synergistaceae bacterium]MBQ7169006.1 diacylglycerol kinase [Synergistaceae bacterium]
MRYSSTFSRLINASRYSLDGLLYALRCEQAFQYEAAVFVIICAVIVVLDVPALLAVVLIGAWIIVMCLELVNSAVEKAFDLISEDFSPAIKAGKDMLSAAVFIMICFNVILWVIVIVII